MNGKLWKNNIINGITELLLFKKKMHINVIEMKNELVLSMSLQLIYIINNNELWLLCSYLWYTTLTINHINMCFVQISNSILGYYYCWLFFYNWSWKFWTCYSFIALDLWTKKIVRYKLLLADEKQKYYYCYYYIYITSIILVLFFWRWWLWWIKFYAKSVLFLMVVAMVMLM